MEVISDNPKNGKGFTKIYSCLVYALSLFIAFIYYFEYIYCFHLSLYVYLLLSFISLNTFITFHYCFKYIYRFPQYFKYIYRFHLHLLCTCEYYIVIIPFPRVFGHENP